MQQEQAQLADDTAPTIMDAPRVEWCEDEPTILQTPAQIAALLEDVDVDWLPRAGAVSAGTKVPDGTGTTRRGPDTEPDRERKALWSLAAVAGLLLSTVVGATAILVRWNHHPRTHIILPPQLTGPIPPLPIQQPIGEPVVPPQTHPTVLFAVPIGKSPPGAEVGPQVPPPITPHLPPPHRIAAKHHRPRAEPQLLDENGIWIPVE